MGLIATLTALVLGLVTASAKGSFDAQGVAVRNIAAGVLVLDRTLAEYGPETAPIRAEIRVAFANRIAATWPEDPPPPGASATGPGEVGHRDRAGGPRAGAEERRAALGSVAGPVERERHAQDPPGLARPAERRQVPTPFLLVITLWLAVLFWSFGLFAPRNGTVLAVLVLTAASVSACVLLILEMQTAFTGFMKVSREPLLYALRNLGGVELRRGGDDLLPERLERRDLVGVGQVEDRLVDARRRRARGRS